MRFRHRLLLFIGALLAVVQILTIAVAYSYARHAMIDAGKRDLAHANRNFLTHLDMLAERVSTGVEVLALDYGLRAAIAEDDRATALSALRNHGRRISAKRMMFVDLDGEVDADTENPEGAVRRFEFEDLIARASAEGTATALTTLEGRTHWTVVAPVLAPTAIGYVAAFVPVDGALLDELRRLESAPISIALIASRPDGGWDALAASDDRADAALPEFNSRAKGVSIQRRSGDDYLISTTALPTAAASRPIFVVHEFRMDDVLASNISLFGPLLTILVGALILAAAGAVAIARSVSAPLESLAAVARRIRSGDYSVKTPARRAGAEVDQLHAALGEMAEAIAAREETLRSAAKSLEIARDAAEAADRAKSQFIANMSHELRTPLNAIIGFADVIRKEQLGPLGAADYGKYAAYIANGGRGLLELHNSILDIARLEAGKFDLHHDVFNAVEIVDAAIESLTPAAEAKGVAISREIADQRARIEGDIAALTKALRNILHNAIKFSPAGGAVETRLAAAPSTIDFVVRDFGVGMPPGETARLLRPFQRGAENYDSEFPGAGLGLSIADRIVTLHGGRLAIETAPMVGTTVTIRLARARAPAKEAA